MKTFRQSISENKTPIKIKGKIKLPLDTDQNNYKLHRDAALTNTLSPTTSPAENGKL